MRVVARSPEQGTTEGDAAGKQAAVGVWTGPLAKHPQTVATRWCCARGRVAARAI